jgi:hypothetical protein
VLHLALQLSLLAVTDSGSLRVIPPIDPANPDPLNTVNTTVISVPNARAEGELGCNGLVAHITKKAVVQQAQPACEPGN